MARRKVALILTDDERVRLDSLRIARARRRRSRVVPGSFSRAPKASTTGWWPGGCECRRSWCAGVSWWRRTRRGYHFHSFEGGPPPMNILSEALSCTSQ